MNSFNPYGFRSSGGLQGDVSTSPDVVRYMLDIVDYTADRNLSQTTLLEPSCGDGNFLVEAVRRLLLSATKYGFDASEIFDRCVTAYDIDEGKVELCKNRLKKEGLNSEFKNLHVADFLSSESKEVDIVVGNPPYVRYENIPVNYREYCKFFFTTFHYRADLYIPFFEKSLKLLKPGGKHCFVCANRWMKNEYGRKLRAMISNRYRTSLIINIERANAFQEEVLAYPAITLIFREEPSSEVGYADCNSVNDLSNIVVNKRNMPKGEDWSVVFSSLKDADGLCRIEDLGFKIGVGVATGADDVFVSKDLPDMVEHELLLPAISAKDLKGDCMAWTGRYLLNPYAANGDLVNLASFPKANRYLEKYKERLQKRHVARKNCSKWYRTIDRIIPTLSFTPKILLPDMSGNRYVFVDEGNYYPMHNLYYITGHGLREQKILSAVLMSENVREQIRQITNNMNGGFPRWQSQYLRKLQIPNIMEISTAMGNDIIDMYEQKNYKELNELVGRLYTERKDGGVSREFIRPVQTNMVFV